MRTHSPCVQLTIRMSHPQRRTSCPLHPVVVSWVGVCARVSPHLTAASRHQEVRGQVAVAATGRMDPGKLHALFVFSAMRAEQAYIIILITLPIVTFITITIIMVIIFIPVIFIMNATIIIIRKRKYDGNKEEPSSCVCSMSSHYVFSSLNMTT